MSPPPCQKDHIKIDTSKCHIHTWSHYNALKPLRKFLTPILIPRPSLSSSAKTLDSSGSSKAAEKGHPVHLHTDQGNVLPLHKLNLTSP